MWELYDELISGIDPKATADVIICGARHSLVKSGSSVGISHTMDRTWRQPVLAEKKEGMALRELAECVKSWDFREASLGLAAINAWYNDIHRVRALGLDVPDALYMEDRSSDPFITLQREIAGKNVTVIGHFPYLDQLFAPVCDLSIIEKFDPQDGDFPEQAADFLLPGSDFVFLSSYTLIEKSLPRYLELSRKAYVTVVGPATPVTPILHKAGAHSAAGFVIKDVAAALGIALGHGGNMHSAGQKVNLCTHRTGGR